jgi:hypothetical protein
LKFTEHGSPIYRDNDVKVFIAGRDAYYEFEINALNTRYEVFFIWEEAYDSGKWVWSRHGIWDSHIPECFTFVHFSTEDVLSDDRR